MKRIWQWVKNKEVWQYALFGMLTTLVNFAVYLLLYNGLLWSAAVCNAAAWLVAVLFAFATNKQFVFRSKQWTWNVLKRELPSFMACRIASGGIETLVLLLCVDMLHFNGNLWKLLAGGFVTVFNYFGSKWLVFRKTK